MNFNPHTREGCDGEIKMQANLTEISIHTPAKGVTGCSLIVIIPIMDFNPHTREGCDFIPSFSAEGGRISIHTPAKGVTMIAYLNSLSRS